MKAPYKKNLLRIIAAGCALALYLMLRRMTGFSIPCLFRTVTGFKCPGCGVTHMLECMLRLDMKGAREANPFLFFTSPFLLFELIYVFLVPRTNSKFHRINNHILIVYCIALIIFGVWRNLPLS